MVSTASRSAPEEASTCSATWSRNRRNERRQHLPWSATPHPVRQAGHETHACVNEQQKERRFKQASHEEGSLTSKPRYFLCSAALTLLPAVRCAVRCSAHLAACSALRSEVQRSPGFVGGGTPPTLPRRWTRRSRHCAQMHHRHPNGSTRKATEGNVDAPGSTCEQSHARTHKHALNTSHALPARHSSEAHSHHNVQAAVRGQQEVRGRQEGAEPGRDFSCCEPTVSQQPGS